ncbi:MAG TPA: ricin-type beta-trefoil lectin domain protein [Polyangiaceae bacterium]
MGQTKQAVTSTPSGSLYVLDKCLDVPGWNDTNGTDVQIYDCHGSTNQQWQFWSDATVRPAFNTNKCLDLPGWQTANGTPIQIYDCTGGTNQRWELDSVGDLHGYGGKCVDDPGFSTTNGTNLQYYDCNSGTSQRFTLAPPMQSTHVFWNLKAQEQNTGTNTAICLGARFEAGGNGELGPGRLVTRNCDGDPDQLWQPIAYDGVSVRLQNAATDIYNGNPLCLDDYADTTDPNTGTQQFIEDCSSSLAEQLFQYKYVESDESGFPCYTIQNIVTGKYVGVANAQVNPVQAGMEIVTWVRTVSDDQVWCDHSATTGFLNAYPDFVITNVVYAPPGKSSSMQYQNTTTVGSSISSSNGFQNSTDVTASASVGVMMNGGMVGASVTANHTFGNTDTQEVDLTTTWAQGEKKPGETNGIDHDWDEIWFIVKPVLNVWFTPGIAGTPTATNWQFGQGDGETTDVTGFAYAGELNGDLQLSAQNQQLFSAFSITPDMYPEILQADAFFQGIAPVPGMNTDRFDYIDEFPYQPPPTPLGPGQMASTQPYSVTQSTSNSDTMTSSYSNTVGVTLSGGFSVGPFKETESVANKWTWTHSSSDKESSGTGSMDTLTVGQPDYGYNGPGFLHVYEDRIFKTYVFTLDYAGAVPVTNDGGSFCQVGGVGMHCCPPGNAMVGVRLDQNLFKCAQLQDTSGQIVADNSTYRNVSTPNPDGTSTTYNMHTCPFGYVMVGLHADLNMLACQQIPPNAISDAITGELVDTGTQDSYPMHVCESTPHAYAMSGFDGPNNLLTCATNPGLK